MHSIDKITATAIGGIGAWIAGIYGGWDSAMTTLLIFMAIDYITGLVVAGVFKKSTKTNNGALESKAGFKGLCRKGMILVILLIASRLDVVLDTTYIKDAVCIGYIANESISILENAGLMGLPLPNILIKSIEILKSKSESESESEEEE